MTLTIHSGSAPRIEEAMKGDRFIGAVGIHHQVEDPPASEQVFETGTAVRNCMRPVHPTTPHDWPSMVVETDIND